MDLRLKTFLLFFSHSLSIFLSLLVGSSERPGGCCILNREHFHSRTYVSRTRKRGWIIGKRRTEHVFIHAACSLFFSLSLSRKTMIVCRLETGRFFFCEFQLFFVSLSKSRSDVNPRHNSRTIVHNNSLKQSDYFSIIIVAAITVLLYLFIKVTEWCDLLIRFSYCYIIVCNNPLRNNPLAFNIIIFSSATII